MEVTEQEILCQLGEADSPQCHRSPSTQIYGRPTQIVHYSRTDKSIFQERNEILEPREKKSTWEWFQEMVYDIGETTWASVLPKPGCEFQHFGKLYYLCPYVF